DVTRARLADGIPIQRGEECDLVPTVAKIVDEIRAAHPARKIHLSTTRCMASFDGDRLEQVLSNLLANAVTHGDPVRRIRVEVEPRDEWARISVHNFGSPIDPNLLPHLFDPFRRAERKPADGLGLGLYISERIIAGHVGKIEVRSTKAGGTRFEAMFPRR
ncbi:MAG TPA: ATP-binding protein, partial [Gemmatimonadaceae bacterium]